MHKITFIVRLSGTSNLLTGDHVYGCQKKNMLAEIAKFTRYKFLHNECFAL